VSVPTIVVDEYRDTPQTPHAILNKKTTLINGRSMTSSSPHPKTSGQVSPSSIIVVTDRPEAGESYHAVIRNVGELPLGQTQGVDLVAERDYKQAVEYLF